MSIQTDEAAAILNCAARGLERQVLEEERYIVEASKRLAEATARRKEALSKLTALRLELGDRSQPPKSDDEVAA